MFRFRNDTHKLKPNPAKLYDISLLNLLANAFELADRHPKFRSWTLRDFAIYSVGVIKPEMALFLVDYCYSGIVLKLGVILVKNFA